MSTVILVPARYGSTRFPGKPLAELAGVPMITRVYDRCKRAAEKLNCSVCVLTDDKRISDLFSPSEVWTDDSFYANGTERCAGFAKSSSGKKYNQFINVQGDMPDIKTDIIQSVYKNLNLYDITTAHTEMHLSLRNDPNSVKMIEGHGQALWFGRGFTQYGTHHLGIYGYKKHALDKYLECSVSEEEKIEKLEQLRWLKSGWKIGTTEVQFEGIEINSPEDIGQWEQKRLS